MPGPGSYKTLNSFTKDGKYFYSRFKDSGSCALRNTERRFGLESKMLALVPGPGIYNHPETINNRGSYFISRFGSSLCGKFAHTPRDPAIDPKKGIKDFYLNLYLVTPGPGSYVMPSEFGIYESTKKGRFLEAEEKSWKNKTSFSRNGNKKWLTATIN